MSRKSPAVAYFYKKIRTTPKSVLLEMFKDSPLTVRDLSLIEDIIMGLTIKELSEKHHLSQSRILKWKRNVSEKVQAFDVANFRR